MNQRKVSLHGKEKSMAERYQTGTVNIPTINSRLVSLKRARDNAQDVWFKNYWQKVIDYLEELKRKQMH